MTTRPATAETQTGTAIATPETMGTPQRTAPTTTPTTTRPATAKTQTGTAIATPETTSADRLTSESLAFIPISVFQS